MPEEARRGQRRNIRLRVKFENAKTLQNHLVYHSRDENNQQIQRFLCEKLQGARESADEISCRGKCYCSTQRLTHFDWLIKVCGSLTCLEKKSFGG